MMFKKILIALFLIVTLLGSLGTPGYANSLSDKRFRLGLDSILLGYYTSVGPQGEPDSLIGLTLLGIGYRKYFELNKPLYAYGEVGTQALFIPYLQGGLIYASSSGVEFKTGLNLSIGVEEIIETDGSTSYNYYPTIGIVLGIGFRF
ncbi:hypothetical protein H5T89_05440 [bacterium]|nr:hypothetical protein [bacterium]